MHLLVQFAIIYDIIHCFSLQYNHNRHILRICHYSFQNHQDWIIFMQFQVQINPNGYLLIKGSEISHLHCIVLVMILHLFHFQFISKIYDRFLHLMMICIKNLQGQIVIISYIIRYFLQLRNHNFHILRIYRYRVISFSLIKIEKVFCVQIVFLSYQVHFSFLSVFTVIFVSVNQPSNFCSV